MSLADWPASQYSDMYPSCRVKYRHIIRRGAAQATHLPEQPSFATTEWQAVTGCLPTLKQTDVVLNQYSFLPPESKYGLNHNRALLCMFSEASPNSASRPWHFAGRHASFDSFLPVS